MGSDLWSPHALTFAKILAKGERIAYPLLSDLRDDEEPGLDYFQPHNNINSMYPSVDFDVGPQLYALGATE
jgi:hypothetical protein